MKSVIRNIRKTLFRSLLCLPLLAFGCCSPPTTVGNDRKMDDAPKEVVTSPQQITAVQFNARYLWRVGSSLEVPSCGKIDLLDISNNGIKWRRDFVGSIPAVPDRVSIGNNVIMVIKEIDQGHKWLRVEFVVRKPYVM